jgi:hypothetical protein
MIVASTSRAWSEFGISFHAGSDSYRLSISGRGGTTLLKRKDGQTQFLTEWETSEAVVAKGRNNLRVVREGSLIVSLINGQPVHQAIDPDFSDGQVRLHVGGEQQVAFDNLRIVEATLSGSTTIEPGESSQFFISYLPDDEGSSTAEAWFATNDTAVSRFKIDLVGNVFLERPSPVAVTNLQRLDFGSLVKVGGRGEQTLRVSNVGRANLEITGYESSSSSLSLIPASGVVEPGGSLAFLVVFSPGVSGPYSGTLTITTNDPVRSHLTIAVEADVAEPEETRIVLVDLQAGEEGNNIPDGTRGLNIRGIGDQFSMEIFVTPPPERTLGGEIVLGYDRSLLAIVSVVIPDGFILFGRSDTLITIGSLGGQALPENGFFASIVFEIVGEISTEGTEIRVASLHLEFVEADVADAYGSVNQRLSRTGDFDGDGIVAFPDFLLFAQRFGTKLGESSFDPIYDLNEDGSVEFGDFLIFAQVFGA